MRHQDRARQSGGEAGFALYLAIGFIVLISALAGSVGTRLNVTALAEARAGDGRASLDRAEAALAEAWAVLDDEFLLDTTYLDGHTETFAAASAADFDKCVAAHDSVTAGYKSFPRTPADNDAYRTYFIKRNAGSFVVYGCGFDAKNNRTAFAEYEINGAVLDLLRMRRY